MRPEPAGKAFTRGRRLAKRSCDVQQAGRGFPSPLSSENTGKKPPESGGFLLAFGRLGPPSEVIGLVLPAMVPARAAVAIVTPIPVAAHHAMLESTVPLAFAVAAAHTGQNGQTALLP